MNKVPKMEEYFDLTLYGNTETGEEPDDEGDYYYTRERYWYHPNYLGNVDMITNDDGKIHQYFVYTPFGENMYQYNRNSEFNSRYRFNSKEIDPETGNQYYGARYYDPKISVWLSVDPLAHKYRSLSSFVFVANNPVHAVDPDGRKIVIVGSDEYQKKVWGSLVSMALKSETGFEQLKTALASDKTLVIYSGNDNSVAKGGEGYETFELNLNTLGNAKDGAPESLEAALGHELSHFNMDIKGTISKTKDGYQIPGVSPEEVPALEIENSIRKEMGIGERKSYSGLDFYGKELGENERYSGYYTKDKKGTYAPTKNGIYPLGDRKSFLDSIKNSKVQSPKSYYRNGKYIKTENSTNQRLYEL